MTFGADNRQRICDWYTGRSERRKKSRHGYQEQYAQDKAKVSSALVATSTTRAIRFEDMKRAPKTARALRWLTDEPRYLFGLVGCPDTKRMSFGRMLELWSLGEKWFVIDGIMEHGMVEPWLRDIGRENSMADWWCGGRIHSNRDDRRLIMRSEADAIMMAMKFSLPYSVFEPNAGGDDGIAPLRL